MGKYSVPQEIRAYKPKGTMVKAINGRYYVYEYSCVGGKTKMGRLIGSIREGIGFIPNSNMLEDSPVTTLEYGQYAAAIACSGKTREMLLSHFSKEDALRIYAMAIMHFANGFTANKDMKAYYGMSWLCEAFPSLPMGDKAVGEIYGNLGARQGKVLEFEQDLIANGSGKLAIDGHVIGSGSWCNSLAEKGYRFASLKDMQMNMLMAYDIEHRIPVAVRVCEGGLNDKASLKDLLMDTGLKDKLIVVDRGFYSASNLELLSSDGNRYIIPVPQNMDDCKSIMAENRIYDGLFAYEMTGGYDAVECRMDDHGAYRVFAFRDKDEAAKKCANYLHMISLGKSGYTEEGYRKAERFFGVYVLRTNDMDMAASEVFSWYKKRWRIETFYRYLKTDAECQNLAQQSYARVQGLSFVLLVASLIHREMAQKVSKIENGRLSVYDVMLMARMVKAQRRGNAWYATNTKKASKDVLEALGVSLKLS